ncbi:MFS transporter [Alkalilimnicola ehrlichii MLHE-1]|uniref:Major facilitator superfamily MFS_1 n=1 Tax=Alkalilimnicola ehrlichii (strain ATCC BAA-1101 / DSM 17681 / MLHE-1) TaxID=187272 RepID=Q0AAN6_ALKEH|nr:MFS transporter [Alkalilimnicola ehrlichii]ABI56101.1 major facilitator superfamily MFS_1 [Alkalilimnicola ehrlichii MLHE-1]
MRIPQLLIAVYCTLLAFSAIYAPQPLLPVLQGAFDVSETRASLLITVTLLPLAIAPVAYGFVLQRFSAKRLLIGATALLAVTEYLIFFVTHFELFLFLRLLQGLLIPAILTALMTYLSASAGPGRIARVMAFYVAATVLGGFLGRALSGLISTGFGWRWSFLFLGLALTVCVLLLRRLDADPPVSFQKLRAGTVVAVLRQPSFLRLYGVIFCAFYVFASLLNFLPFRLVELGSGMNETGIALMYSGYLMGVVTSLLSLRIAGRIGGPVNTMLLGTVIFAGSLLFFLGHSLWLIFAGMFVFCGGMFLIHSLAPGFLNQRAGEQRGVVNGLYIAFYYAGGTVGSFIPGFIYHSLGWAAYLASLAAVLALAGYWLTGLRRQTVPAN